MNRRSKIVPIIAAAFLMLAVVGMASPASAQRYSRHRRGGSDWGISLNFGSPYSYDGYGYGGDYGGVGLEYYSYPSYSYPSYSYPSYSYRHNRYRDDDDYRGSRHDRGNHNGWRNHRR